MKETANNGTQQLNPGFLELSGVCKKLRFEAHDIAGLLDSKGHYDVKLDRQFPLLIKLFHYTSRRHTRGGTWHERLELFMPLDGPAVFKMGNRDVRLQRGEMLIVDNLKLHHVVDFPGFDTRVVVVSFLPDFVYNLGAPAFDYAYLLPFYQNMERRAHVVPPVNQLTSQIYFSLARLLECYFDEKDRHFFQGGCKAYLLELLFHLSRYFRSAGVLKWEFVRQQERSLMLKPLFDHISAHYSEKLTVARAAALAGMSEARFTKMFKRVSGLNLIAYLNNLRVSRSAQLLSETELAIAEIAQQVGFSDQSHFDRRFKDVMGLSPRDFRAGKSHDVGSL